MKRWTASHQIVSLCTGSCKAKPWLALPNHHVKSLFFWDIMKCWVVIPYGRFRTTYWSHLQESRIPKEQSMSEFNWNNLLMRCSSNCVWIRWWSASDESLNWNAECACACGTQAEGGTVRSAVAVDDEMVWQGARGVRAGKNCTMDRQAPGTRR